MSRTFQFPSGDSIRIGTAVSVGLAGLALLVVVYVLATGIYKVNEYEEAVVLRFGRYHRPAGPGLHLKMPWIEQAITVDTSESSLRLPWGVAEMVSPGQQLYVPEAQQEESLILTGDLYAAVVEWNVFWRIDDPKQFVVNFGDPETLQQTILAVARSTMHRAVGDYSADEVLTGKREEVKMAAWNDMTAQLDRLGAGVAVTEVQMQRVTPPERVKPSFDEVNASIQQRDQLVNEARRERNQLIPAAQAQADRLIREAEGYAARRLAESQGEINALLAKYESYQAAPEVTRQRMYLETMEQVLGNSGQKTILDSDLNGLLPLLNLGQPQ